MRTLTFSLMGLARPSQNAKLQIPGCEPRGELRSIASDRLSGPDERKPSVFFCQWQIAHRTEDFRDGFANLAGAVMHSATLSSKFRACLKARVHRDNNVAG